MSSCGELVLPDSVLLRGLSPGEDLVLCPLASAAVGHRMLPDEPCFASLRIMSARLGPASGIAPSHVAYLGGGQEGRRGEEGE